MLSAVLRSDIAIEVSIRIIDEFVAMRRYRPRPKTSSDASLPIFLINNPSGFDKARQDWGIKLHNRTIPHGTIGRILVPFHDSLLRDARSCARGTPYKSRVSHDNTDHRVSRNSARSKRPSPRHNGNKLTVMAARRNGWARLHLFRLLGIVLAQEEVWSGPS